MSQDRIGKDVLPSTQEFLAQMLGTRRASVSVAAATLQKAGLITYTRGHVSILHRAGSKKPAASTMPSFNGNLRIGSEKWK